MTASAAGLVDVYSIQKPGMPKDEENDVNTTGTGTVTNTETGSSILTDNEGIIKGIVLDRDTVEAEAGKEETLTAEIILDGEINFSSISGNDPVDVKKEEAFRRLSEKITWRLGRLNANGEFVQDTSLSETLGIKIKTEEGAAKENVDRRVLTLIPKHGTAVGKDIYIQASINSSYFIDEKGNVNAFDTDLGDVSALAKVSVKEYTKSLKWKWQVEGSDVRAPKAYLNYAIDLSKYLVRDPETANDMITWAVACEKGVATVTTAGVVTVKKANKAFTVYAVGERCERLSWTVTSEVGVPATGVEIWALDAKGEMINKLPGTTLVDVGAGKENEDKTIAVKAKLIVNKKVVLDANGQVATTEDAANAGKGNKTTYKVASKKIAEGDSFIEASSDKKNLVTPEGKTSPVQTLKVTDYVLWSSNKTGIANVVVDPANDRLATITVSKDAQVGSAAIMAKTPKKSAKANIKVSATLLELEITNTEKELYTGQTLQMTYRRTPSGNKDSVKWSVTSDKEGNNKAKSASINSKGLLTIRPTITNNESKVYVCLKSPKKGSRAEVTAAKYEISLKQSSIDGIKVTQTNPSGGGVVANVGLDNKGRVKQLLNRAGTTNLDIPMNARYIVDVTPGSNGDPGLTKEIAVNTLTYKNSKPKIVEITRSSNGKLTITPKASGTAKITVSGIRATESRGKVTGKAISTSFNVKVSQPVTSVILNKPTIVLAEKKKANGDYQDVKISGLKATFGPKKANKSAEKKIAKWEIRKEGEEEWTTIPKSKTNSNPNTSATLSYNLGKAKAGDVYTVRVTTATGLTRTSTVKIVSPAAKLVLAKEVMNGDSPIEYSEPRTNQAKVEVGNTIPLYPYVNIGTTRAASWKKAGEINKTDGYVADDVVSYSVNKKGIVNISQENGKTVVKGMKDGKVTITAKTATGKSAKLTVTVSLPTQSSN